MALISFVVYDVIILYMESKPSLNFAVFSIIRNNQEIRVEELLKRKIDVFVEGKSMKVGRSCDSKCHLCQQEEETL